MRDRRPSNADEIIATFLANFGYLNQDGKRKYTFFISFIWLNKELTGEIEKESNKLIKELNQLKLKQMPEDEKCQALLDHIQQSVSEVIKYRKRYAPVHNHDETIPAKYNENGRMIKDGMWDRYDYKIPYAAGKFEKKVLAGLNSIMDSLNEILQSKCNQVIDNIKNYSPETIIFNRDVYVP